MSQTIVITLILISVVVVFTSCRKPATALQVGGIYSTADGEDGYGVVKLLAYEDGICHVRIYKQKFKTRPTVVDISTLSLGKPGDPDGFGMGHIPMREAGFLAWQPVLIIHNPVTTEELEGYKL